MTGRAGWKDAPTASASSIGEDHILRNCSCHFCQSDRRTFREHLDQTLTPEEVTILDICDRIEPLIRRQIRQMRRDVFEWVLPRVEHDFTDEQRAELLDHLDECANTKTEVRSTAHQAERLLGYYVHAVTTFDSLTEFFNRDWFYSHLLPAGTPLPNDPNVRDLCISRATATGEKIFDLLDYAVADFEHLHETIASSHAQELRTVTQALLSTVLGNVVTHDLFGRTSHSKVYPLSHQSCVQEVLCLAPLEDSQESVIRRTCTQMFQWPTERQHQNH